MPPSEEREPALDNLTDWRTGFGRLIDSPWFWLAGITLLTAACVQGLLVVAPWDKIDPDFICYWAAGEDRRLGPEPLRRGAPDPDSARARLGQGDRRAGPVRFPPLLLSPLVRRRLRPPGPAGIRRSEGRLVRPQPRAAPAGGLSRCATPSPACRGRCRRWPSPFSASRSSRCSSGQTSILMLFLAALAWKLMKRGNDRLAGAALACLTTKPQLTVVLVLALLLWCARQRRWGVVLGFAATLAALALLGAWIVPAWPIEMLRAAERHPAADGLFPLDRHHLAAGAQDGRPALVGALGTLPGGRPPVPRGAPPCRARSVAAAGRYPVPGPDRPLHPGPLWPPLRFPGPADPGVRPDRPPALREGRHGAPGRACWSCPMSTWASSSSSGRATRAPSASSRSGPSSGFPCW